MSNSNRWKKTVFKATLIGLACFILSGRSSFAQAPKDRGLNNVESLLLDSYFNDKSNKPPRLTLQLVNYSAEDLSSLVLQLHAIVPGRIMQPLAAKFDKQGKAEVTLKWPLPNQTVVSGLGNLFSGSFLLNQHLTVELNVKQLKSKPVAFFGEGVAFKGPDKSLAEYLATYAASSLAPMQTLHTKMQKALAPPNLTSAQKRQHIEQYFNSLKKVQHSFIKDNPSKFAWLLENERQSDRLNTLLMELRPAAFTNTPLAKEVLAHKPALLSMATISYYNTLALLMTLADGDLQSGLIRKQLTPRLTDDQLPGLETLLDQMTRRGQGDASSTPESQRIVAKFYRDHGEVLKSVHLSHLLAQIDRLDADKANVVQIMAAAMGGWWKREDYIARIQTTMRPGWCRTVLLEDWKAEQTNLKKMSYQIANTQPVHGLGTPLDDCKPGFTLFEANHSSPGELISAIRSSFHDKRIILDVWSTSCAPCISEISSDAAKKSKQQLKMHDVEVVFVCTDSTDKQWRSVVESMDAPGTHIFLPDRLSDAMMEFIQSSSVPKYVLIDCKGNIDNESISGVGMLDIAALKKQLVKSESN